MPHKHSFEGSIPSPATIKMNDYFKPFLNPWHYRLKDYKEFSFWKRTVKNCFYENPRHLIRWVKYFFQRGSRGWADCDWWEMHSYLCEIIIPMLKKLKENKHGVPCELDENFDEAVKKWNVNIDAMITAFEAADRILNDDYYKEEWSKAIGDRDLEDVLSDEDMRKLVEKTYKMAKADEKVFHKNVKVFTRWFFSLWD